METTSSTYEGVLSLSHSALDSSRMLSMALASTLAEQLVATCSQQMEVAKDQMKTEGVPDARRGWREGSFLLRATRSWARLASVGRTAG